MASLNTTWKSQAQYPIEITFQRDPTWAELQNLRSRLNTEPLSVVLLPSQVTVLEFGWKTEPSEEGMIAARTAVDSAMRYVVDQSTKFKVVEMPEVSGRGECSHDCHHLLAGLSATTDQASPVA